MPSFLANKNVNAEGNLESASGDSFDLASSSSDATQKVEKIEISPQWLIEPETEPCSGLAHLARSDREAETDDEIERQRITAGQKDIDRERRLVAHEARETTHEALQITQPSNTEMEVDADSIDSNADLIKCIQDAIETCVSPLCRTHLEKYAADCPHCLRVTNGGDRKIELESELRMQLNVRDARQQIYGTPKEQTPERVSESETSAPGDSSKLASGSSGVTADSSPEFSSAAVSDVADQQHSSAAAAIPSEPEVAQRQPQIQQHNNSSILQQGFKASEARVEAMRNLEEASATLSLDLEEVHEIVKNTDTTRGAAAAYRQLLIAFYIHTDAESKTALKSAKVRIRDLAMLRCQCEVGSQDKDAYFDALTAAFGTLLDEVPNLQSQLKLAYHKVVNSHPSKNQIETDKRGSQRPGRRRSPSRTRPQDRIASSSSVNNGSNCCASAAVEADMTLQHAHAPQCDAAQTVNNQSSRCASTTVEDTVPLTMKTRLLPSEDIVSFRPPPGLEMRMLPSEDIDSLLMMNIRDFRDLLVCCPIWLMWPANSLQQSLRTVAQTSWCCSVMRRRQAPIAAAVGIKESAKAILAMDIVVNDRTYRFNKVVAILLSVSWPWESLALHVQTDKLYTPEPRGPYK